ncbi:MAG: MazG family protein [Desulfatiglandales bacterium]
MIEAGFTELVEIIKTLRGPNGCPWDRAQTLKTAKEYVLEEAYELLDAVEKTDHKGVLEEAGDLLFQVLFLINLEEEEGSFHIKDVIRNVKEKMIRRHPHVFGNASVKDADEVLANWQKIKEEEKGKKNKGSNGMPYSMPGSKQLTKIFKMLEKKAIRIDIHDIAKRLKHLSEETLFEPDQELESKKILNLLLLLILYAFTKSIDIDSEMKRFAHSISRQLYSLTEEAKGLNLDDILPNA